MTRAASTHSAAQAEAASRVPAPSGDTHPIERMDLAAARAAAPLRDHPLVQAAGRLSELADQPPLIALSSAVLGFGLARRDARLARAGGRMLAAHLLATGIKTIVKSSVDRTRPAALLEQRDYRFERGDDSDDHDLTSFPSGHTAGAIAVSRALAREYPGAAVPGYLVTGLVAAVQVPRCTHYPSDIGAGALIGLAAEAAVDAAVSAVTRRFPEGLGFR